MVLLLKTRQDLVPVLKETFYRVRHTDDAPFTGIAGADKERRKRPASHLQRGGLSDPRTR